jgi:DNA-binding GntR family transcriptional regulator
LEASTRIVPGSIPKYRQLLFILRNEILTGAFQPGSRLPSEEELSSAYGLSRGTVRKAISQLEAERLITTEQGVGSFVQTSHPNAIPFYFVDPSPLQVGSRAKELRFEVLAQEEIPAPLDIGERLRLPLGATVIHIARRRILDDQVLSFTERYLNPAIAPSLASEDLTQHPFLHYLLVSQSELPLMRSEIDIEAHLLSEEEAELLQTEVGCSAIVVNRMTFTAPNTPAVWYRGLFKEEYHLAVRVSDESTLGCREEREA